jgi:hypothetical protein
MRPRSRQPETWNSSLKLKFFPRSTVHRKSTHSHCTQPKPDPKRQLRTQPRKRASRTEKASKEGRRGTSKAKNFTRPMLAFGAQRYRGSAWELKGTRRVPFSGGFSTRRLVGQRWPLRGRPTGQVRGRSFSSLRSLRRLRSWRKVLNFVISGLTCAMWNSWKGVRC